MWFPAPELLAKTTPANAFLVCRWDEFFDSHTPDTYRPRICHLPILVNELAEVGRLMSSENGLRKHLLHIQQEAWSLLQEDSSVFKLCNATDRTVLTEIATQTTDPSVVALKASQLSGSGFEARYEASAIERGQAEIVRHLSKASLGKRGADRWLGLWATIALHRRYVWSTAFRQRDLLALSRPMEENAAEIAVGLAPRKNRYVCVVAVTARPERKDATPISGEMPLCVQRIKAAANAAGIRVGHHGWLPESTQGPNQLVLVGDESGVGPVDALHQFARGLQPMLNLLGFYRGAAPAEPIRKGWAGLSRNALNSYEILPLTPGRLHPRRKALRLVKSSLGMANSGRLDGILANALELHNVAISSIDMRVQFVLMWSALECLASIVPGQSVISRIIDLLVPIVSWRRIEKQIRYLAFSLRDWRSTIGTDLRKLRVLPNSTREEVLGEDVLLTITRPLGHSDMVELLNAVSHYPLLLWRTNTTWEIFHDPSNLAMHLCRARERLTWHLGRIYRVRNRLVHAGDDSTLLPSLLDNLQFYLSTVISRLLHGVALDASNDAAKAAAYWRAHGERVQKQLVDSPATLKVEDLMANPRLCRDRCPWASRP